MSVPVDVKNLTQEAFRRWLARHSVEPYRAGQIFRWIYHRRVSSFSHMTDLSKALRAWLSDRLVISRFEPTQAQHSVDGSRKYLFSLAEGHHIESVLIPERNHWTLCVSSQVGCAMGCQFCLTARGGFVRNLQPAEIVNQVCAVQKDLPAGKPLTNIVFMGMGEPLANYDNVIQAIDIITGNDGLHFSNRRITLSTAGLVPRMKDLGRDMTVNLAVSLNAADNRTRNQLMPINRTYPMEALLAACGKFPLPSRRMITFEYVLLAGVNDRAEDARRLAGLLKPLRAKINLIPFNAFEGAPFKTPEEDAILAFQRILLDRHYTAIVRRSKGGDIHGACGQLRARQGLHGAAPEGGTQAGV